MHRISAWLGGAALALAGLALQAEDFQPLMKAAQMTWPEKRHLGVICNYPANATEVQALARAAGEGAFITVIDARTNDKANLAAALLANRQTDFLVLMPHDTYYRDGTIQAQLAVNRLASLGIPAIGTRPESLRQGAVFAQGEGTEGELLVTDRLIGTVKVILPDPMALSQKSSLVIRQEGMATILLQGAP